MATTYGTTGNDSWTVIKAGTFVLDGLGGTDSLYLGTSLRSDYKITKAADGSVHIDSVSGASSALHATLFNMETLVFNNKRDVLDLTTYFGNTTPPTVSITDNTAGVATGNVTYSLAFSQAVTGLSTSDFSVVNGTVLSVSGSGASYAVVVAPAANTEGSMTLALKASAVSDSAGNTNAQTSAAAQAVDTLAPSVTGVSPANLATGVAVGSNIVLTFSEAIQRGAGTITIRDGAGNTVASYDAASSGNLSVSGSTLTIDPSADLAVSTSYSVTMSAGSVRDGAGNGASSGSATFSTAAYVTVTGTSGADQLLASGSAPIAFDGLAGIDSVSFGKSRAAYTLTHTAGGYSVSDGLVVDTLTNVERVHFADGQWALDLDGHAGLTAKVLGAVFGPSAVSNKEYVGVGLGLLDGNMSYADLVQLALSAKLGANASNAAVVHLLYTNVAGANSPSAVSDEAYFVGLLDSHALTVAELGVLAANTDLNQAHVDLVGLAATGLAFI